jgi:hypothetical protein
MIRKSYTKVVLVTLSVFVVGFIGFLIYNTLTFRLVGTTPKLTGKTPSSTSQVTLSFNKTIAGESVTNDSIRSDGLVQSFRVEEKKVILSFEALVPEKEYSFGIENIRSTDGKVINSLSFRFTAQYVDFGKLSEKDQAEQIQATNPVGSLSTVLPYDAPDYYIGILNQGGESIISIEMKFSYPDQTNPQYLELVRKNREAALEYLSSKGVDVSKYKFSYSEQVLLNEFPAQYTPQEEFTGDGAPPEELSN